MTVEREADIPGLIPWHQQPDDDALPGIAAQKRRSRVAMNLGVEDLEGQGIAPEPVEEPLGTVVISLLPGVLVVGGPMAAMLSALLCGFDQRSIPVQKPAR